MGSYSQTFAVQSLCLVMNEGYYSLPIIIPFVVFLVAGYTVVAVLLFKGKRPLRLIAIYAFPDVIEKKTDNNGATRWLLKDIYIEDGSDLLLKVLRSIGLLGFALFLCVVMVFFQLLLVDISYSCDLEDKNKDCFEYKVLDTSRFSKEPINCSSDAVLNGTVDVVCYKIVFNAGLAMGASYGTFKISVAVINLGTTVLLMIKQTKTISKIRRVLSFLFVGLIVGLGVIQFTTWRVFLVSDALSNTFQAVATACVGCVFVIAIPWKDLVTMKNVQNHRQNNQRDCGMEINMAQE